MAKLYRQYVEVLRGVEDYTVGIILATLLERRAHRRLAGGNVRAD